MTKRANNAKIIEYFDSNHFQLNKTFSRSLDSSKNSTILEADESLA